MVEAITLTKVYVSVAVMTSLQVEVVEWISTHRRKTFSVGSCAVF